MALDNITATSMSRRVRWTWLAADILLLGAYTCFFLERNNNYVGTEYVLIPWFLPWVLAWIYFIFWRRFGDILAKMLALGLGSIWNYECYEGILRFVYGGLWDHVIGFMTHEFIKGLGFCFIWSVISWLFGGMAFFAIMKTKRWLAMRTQGDD